MPGRRCLLCADVDDLLDGEVLLELTRMLLSDAVPSPSDAGDAYDDTARVELALEALAGGAASISAGSSPTPTS